MNISEALINCILAIGTATGLFAAIKKWLDGRFRRRWALSVRSIRRMERDLEESCEALGALKIRILDCTNTNGIPTPQSSRLYSTVVWEFPRTTDVVWEKVTCDSHLSDMLFDLIRNPEGHREGLVKDISDSAILKGVYGREGVKTSAQAVIGFDAKCMYWITVHFSEEKKLTPIEWEIIRNLTASLKYTFRVQ